MTTFGLQTPQSRDEFAAYWSDIESLLDPKLRLPKVPFLAGAGQRAVTQYDRLLGASFVPVLRALGEAHGDRSVTLVVIDPAPSYYQEEYSFYPAFRAPVEGLDDEYWAGLSYEPRDDPTGAIAFTANVIAVVGSTMSWAVWGERRWELALVQASATDRRWLNQGVPFLPPGDAIEAFTAPSDRRTLTDAEVAAFIANAAG